MKIKKRELFGLWSDCLVKDCERKTNPFRSSIFCAEHNIIYKELMEKYHDQATELVTRGDLETGKEMNVDFKSLLKLCKKEKIPLFDYQKKFIEKEARA